MVEQSGEDVVIQVHMHCQGCADKVSACLRGFDGVEQVEIDRENHKVIARGKNVDPLMVLERVRKKHYSNAELISPRIMETMEPEPPPEEPKEIPIKIFVLKVPMHCQKCAIDIRTKLFEIEGVLTVEPNMEEGTVNVKGAVEAVTLVEHMRKLRKHADVVSEELVVPDEKKKRKKKKKKKKNKKRKKEDEKEEEQVTAMVVFDYPPRCCCDHKFCPCEAFNDENVNSCMIM